VNAVEEIEAAIAKLTKLRDDSSVGVWYQSMVGISSKTETMGRYSVIGDVADEDTALIVTLHRTIDAQLDFLRTARGFYGAGLTGDAASSLFAEHALQMARAINGTTS
jgi:hypothetical protein